MKTSTKALLFTLVGIASFGLATYALTIPTIDQNDGTFKVTKIFLGTGATSKPTISANGENIAISQGVNAGDNTNVNQGLFSSILGGGEAGTYQIIDAGVEYSTIAGGLQNMITDAVSSAIGGGYYNKIASNCSTILGGLRNTIQDTLSFIGGGNSNIISSKLAIVIGGYRNTITENADHSLAMGQDVVINTPNTFAYSDFFDDYEENFESTTPSTFIIRSANGLLVNTNQVLSGINTNFGGPIQISGALDNCYNRESGEISLCGRVGSGCTPENAGVIEFAPASSNFIYCNGYEWHAITNEQGYIPTQQHPDQLVECLGNIPNNATINGTGNFMQIRDGAEYIPSEKVWNYSLTTGECTYACNANYHLSGTNCVADIRVVNCSGATPSFPKIINSLTNLNYNQIRNGTERTPTKSRTYNLTQGECNFKCELGYQRNGTNCAYTYSRSTGAWSAFDSCQPNDGICGAGTKTRTRTVFCLRNDGINVADSFCSGSGLKPTNSESISCEANSCSSAYNRELSSFSTCSVTQPIIGDYGTCNATSTLGSRGDCTQSCGTGSQTRSCINNQGTKTRTCSSQTGSQTRTAVCKLISTSATVNDSFCISNIGPKPATFQSCSATCEGVETSQSCTSALCGTSEYITSQSCNLRSCSAIGTCGGSQPSNTILNFGTTFSQTRNGSIYSPASKNYGYSEVTGEECSFRCDIGMEWNGEECENGTSILPPAPGIPCERAEDITYNGITIKACNEGASVVGNGSTADAYGTLFQRGNNYPFPNKTPATYTPNTSTKANTSTYGPLSPYSSSMFIKATQRSSSFTKTNSAEVNNLRGGKSDTTSKNGAGTHVYRRGPCPAGYHVPSTLERKTLLNGVASSSEGYSVLRDTLYLPLAGQRVYSSAALGSQGSNGYYWSSSPYTSAANAYYMSFTTSTLSPQANLGRGYGLSVRCFKDSDGSAHQLTEGMSCLIAPDITINGFTFQACNVGASVVGFDTGSYGNLFQRGNNYPFPNGSPTIYTPNSASKVNASAYGPGNYYTSSTFITASTEPYERDSSNNRNLRGGSGDKIRGNGLGTQTDRRGPCPAGYHVPSTREWRGMLNGNNPYKSSNYYLPDAPVRLQDAYLIDFEYDTDGETAGYYRSSSPDWKDATSYGMYFYSEQVEHGGRGERAQALSVRCFKDTDYGITNQLAEGMSCLTAPDITINGHTFQACNVGASVVGFGPDSYGSLFQRGNNYGFPNKDRLNGTYTPNSATKVNTSTYGPSNPYSSDTFIKAIQRSSSFTATISAEVNNLRGGKSDTTSTNGPGTYAQRRGPCPAGYHVPSISERWEILDGNPFNSPNYFLPLAGSRSYSNTSLYDQDDSGYYRSSSPNSTSSTAHNIYFFSSDMGGQAKYRGDGLSVRCFKNIIGTCANYTVGNGIFTAGTPNYPNTAWQTTNSEDPCYVTCSPGYIWIRNKCSPLNPAFYGFVSGDCLIAPDITVNGYTMMACNLGAQNVATSRNDQLSYGYLYQRGNNYGFPNKDRLNGGYTPSSLLTDINTSAYGPSNPYSSSMFIRKIQRSSSFTANINDEANNLRGGKSDTTSTNGPGTGVDRRGPCPTGYHVPSTLERKNALGGQNPYDYFSTYKLPLAGNRDYSNTYLSSQASYGYYWSSSPYANAGYAYGLVFNWSVVDAQLNNFRGNAYSIRCFKNSDGT